MDLNKKVLFWLNVSLVCLILGFYATKSNASDSWYMRATITLQSGKVNSTESSNFGTNWQSEKDCEAAKPMISMRIEYLNTLPFITDKLSSYELECVFNGESI